MFRAIPQRTADIRCIDPDPHNRARNRMRGAKRDAKERQEYDGYAASCLGTKSAYRMQLCQTHSESFYDSPAAKVSAQSYSRMARKNYP